MVELKALQEEVYHNKLAKGFNVTDICQEFCHAHAELSEAFDAYIRKRGSVGEELADVAIYLLGLAQILDIDLETEILAKIRRNEQRTYEMRRGVLTRVDEE